MFLLNEWEGCSPQDVLDEFHGKLKAGTGPKDINIILASYAYIEDGWGNAFVLFLQHGKLWEVNASHCSCYGLEGQWEPEEADIQELRHRIHKGRLGDVDDGAGRFREELIAVLDMLESQEKGN